MSNLCRDVNVIQPDSSITEHDPEQNSQVVYYPLLFYIVLAKLKRLFLEPKHHLVSLVLDPIRLLPEPCDAIPKYEKMPVNYNSLIPFQNQPETFDSTVNKYIRILLSKKYPLVFPPSTCIQYKTLLYKPFIKTLNQDDNSWTITDTLTGETFTYFSP